MIAASSVPIVLMHHKGAPETMQDDPRYDDVLIEVYLWLEERIEAAEKAGIRRDRILVDPGFGFGKNVGHNLELMNGLALLHPAWAVHWWSAQVANERSVLSPAKR